MCWGAQDGWGGSAEFWWWWAVLVSVSKILTFAFCHLVFSWASCYSCFWLELVPQVIMLASISRPGRLSFSGQSTLCRQALLLQGSCPDIWCLKLSPGRSCIALTRGPKIPWRVLWGSWGCLQTLSPRCPGAGLGADWKGLMTLVRPGFLLP